MKINNQKKSKYFNKGQVMILSVILLGGILVSATAIAGLLVIYQIRQANDAVSSARAFFAADAALEWGIFKYTTTTLSNLSFTTIGISSTDTTSTDGSFFIISAEGFSGRAVRALEALF